MSLLRVWKDRKADSPHRPKRARTGWMILALIGVFLAIWLLGLA
ncbi:MAG: hypothetical protein ACREMK_03620 [Gemmatimonadota bacterium]